MSLVTALRASTFTESKAASDLTTVQTCNGVSTQSSIAPQRMVYAGAATGSWSFSQTKNTTKNFEFYSDTGFPNSTSWASGNWVVQLNVTAASGQADTWTATCIIRVNASGAAQATVGSLTGQSIGLNSTGVKSMTISGAAQASAGATDRIVVVMNFTTANTSPSQHSWTIDAGNAANDLVTTPVAVNFSGGATETNSTSDAMGRVAGLYRAGAETQSASDALAGIHGILAGLTETHSSADLLSRWAAFGRGESETNSANDSLARLAALHRAEAETLSASDVLGRLAGFRAAPSVTLTASDALAGQRGSSGAQNFAASLSESVTHSDALLRRAALSVGLAQSLSLTADLNALRNVKRSFRSGQRVLGGKSTGRQTTFKAPPKGQ